jgi:serine phosphatase RsbU (regulator of sigma subunit)
MDVVVTDSLPESLPYRALRPGPPSRVSARGSVRAPDLRLPPDLRLATKQSGELGASGDFFEVFDHGDGRISAVVADVCGNGAVAAQIANRLSPFLRRSLARGESPARVLESLNEELLSYDLLERFVTAVAVRIDVLSGLAEIACAGHMGPFVRRASGRVEALNGTMGVPLGFLPGETYGEISLELDADDALVLVTDGITDPLSTLTDPLGEAGLLRRLEASPHATAAICRALLVEDTFVRDDATVLVVQLPARDAERIAA